jgi:rhodanese-related sulfurtransferase
MIIKSVNAETLKRWMDNNEAILIDVREPVEHSEEKIMGASLIPLAIVTKTKLPENAGKKIVIHCRSGKRSAMACEKLLIEDAALDLYNLEGGILAWRQAGLPVK